MKTEDDLDHFCKLALIAADMIMQPDFDPTECDDKAGTINCYRILAEAFLELQSRYRQKPRFRVRAMS